MTMTKEQIDAIPRVEARQLLARVPAGHGYDDRVLLAVEQAMNMEWWRGYWKANMNWQPIATCKPEGIEHYLLWNGERVFMGWLDDDGWHDATNQDRDDEPESPQPTHWMPLPGPPNA